MLKYIKQDQLDNFVNSVNVARSFAEVAAICVEVESQLEQARPNICSRKNANGEYRRPFNSVAARKLSRLMPRLPGSTLQEHSERALQAIEAGFWNGSEDDLKSALVLAVLNISPADIEEFNAGKNNATELKQEDAEPIVKPLEYLEKARSMLQSRFYSHIAVGLCVVTGRRQYEILAKAHFKKLGNAAVHFTGRAKIKGDDNGFNTVIPTLVSANEVITALAALREKKPDFIDASVTKTNACNKELNKLLRRELGEFNLETLHGARGAYAAIAHVGFNKSRKGTNLYYSRVLAHSDKKSAQDYQVYRILENDRQPLMSFADSLMNDGFDYWKIPNPIEKF
ncbi:protelomerase family protein [Rhabdochromatium marinum]|uniref:protelomerase family protein n=1 Tax=Rhabdochromatium marinum TaxID=48729 RepID=UPI0019089ADA|nr:protelomerase family protein [Rhabdochromatium marinum]MBK1650575.1 hypothetical protein [Rhabdochromatium marinum]